jgi:hypothetical protein
MASGCVPAHASYFLAYEHLKMYLNFDNQQLNFSSTLFIGAFTTFAHDFFIAPADGKFLTAKTNCSLHNFSDETANVTLQEFNCEAMHKRHY